MNVEEGLLVEGVDVAGKRFEVVVACWILRGSRFEVIKVFRD